MNIPYEVFQSRKLIVRGRVDVGGPFGRLEGQILHPAPATPTAPVTPEPLVAMARPVQPHLRAQPRIPARTVRTIKALPPVVKPKKKPAPRFESIQPELLDELPDQPLMPFR